MLNLKHKSILIGVLRPSAAFPKLTVEVYPGPDRWRRVLCTVGEEIVPQIYALKLVSQW